MDFEFSDEQNMLRELAREILEAEATPELNKAVESEGDFFAEGLWAKLAEANLLGLAIPEAQGGMGFGIFELCILLEECGRTVAPIPVVPTLVLGGLAIGRFGSDGQRAQWLSAIAAGEVVLSGTLVESGTADPAEPVSEARREGDGWVIDGKLQRVPAALRAKRLLVPARVEGGVGLFLVDPKADGVLATPQVLTHREQVHDLVLAGVHVSNEDVLPVAASEGGAAVAWLHQCALLANCALQLGVSSRALEITAQYVSEREQFGGPIGAFQAVQHRCADGFIDLQGMRWTLWRAAWMLSDGQDATREAMVAKFWAAEGGSRIASSAQHLHAGAGVDLDYVIHRYFIWTKALELSLGAATPQLVRLGRDMARTGPEEKI
jgi:alkylation response protein AidB-like acyl-CoA dehydrogenase